MKRSVGSVCLFALSSAVGCAAEVGEGLPGEGASAGDEVVSTGSEALIGDWVSGPYTWDQTLRRRKLPSIAANVCVLTRLTGKFEGMGEAVQVTDDGKNWFLEGFSQQRDLAAEAYCFPRDKFRGNDANTRVSSQYARWASDGCVTESTEMYAADAFAFLSGIQGALHGGGEFGLVVQPSSTELLSTLESRSCADGGLTAFARNFRVGTRTERLARFVGPQGVGDASMEEFMVGDTPTGWRSEQTMGSTTGSMCAFTRIQGKFAGGGEWIEIRPETGADDVERWVLRARRGAGSNYIHARARCFTREQRPFGPWTG